MDILYSDFQANQFHDSLFNYELTRCMENSVDPDQLASLDVSLLGSTLFSIDCLSFLCCFQKSLYMGVDVRKPVFGGLRITQAQTSLRIRPV